MENVLFKSKGLGKGFGLRILLCAVFGVVGIMSIALSGSESDKEMVIAHILVGIALFIFGIAYLIVTIKENGCYLNLYESRIEGVSFNMKKGYLSKLLLDKEMFEVRYEEIANSHIVNNNTLCISLTNGVQYNVRVSENIQKALNIINSKVKK